MAVTDHDTTAAFDEVDGYARPLGIDVVPGIEITAVERGADVHVLGYFIDPATTPLQEFLRAQRANRIRRVEQIAQRLRELGLPIDLGPVLDESRGTARAVGRPQIARAMIAAGYVADVTEAFNTWLGRDRPAFVPRAGAPPEDVIAIIHGAGGVASLAHPGRTAIDERIPPLVRAGLDAIEVFHSDHDPAQRLSYGRLAADLRCLVTGGSDFHGDPARAIAPGSTTLPSDHWDRLRAARASRG